MLTFLVFVRTYGHDDFWDMSNNGLPQIVLVKAKNAATASDYMVTL